MTNLAVMIRTQISHDSSDLRRRVEGRKGRSYRGSHTSFRKSQAKNGTSPSGGLCKVNKKRFDTWECVVIYKRPSESTEAEHTGKL